MKEQHMALGVLDPLPSMPLDDSQRPKSIADQVPAEYLRDKCIHEVFEAQAAQTPRSTALIFEGRRLTYRQLSLQSTRFAFRLESLGVRPGSFVALYTLRSMETIVALLGILKAGAAYVALDMERVPKP